MKVVIYARESESDIKKAPSIAEQIKRGKQWVENNGHELIRVYGDNGFSGGDWNRPQFNRLIKDARNKGKDFNALWVWSQDRLARDTEQFLWFYRNLKHSRIIVFSEIEGEVEMETLGGRVKNTVLAMTSEIFRITTGEKVKKAYRYKKQKEALNFKWGRDMKQIDMEKVRELKEKGQGWRKIAKEIGGVSHVTIKNRWEALINTPPKKTEETEEKNEGVTN